MSCSAYGCTNRTSKKTPGITFHRFPKDETLRKIWVKAVRRENWNPTQYSSLCSDHFEESDFDKCSTLRVYLKSSAVPSCFKAFPKYLQKPKYTRKQPHPRGQQNIQECTGEENLYLLANVALDPILQSSENLNFVYGVPLPSVVQNQLNLGQEQRNIPSPTKEELKRKLQMTEEKLEKSQKKIKFLQQTTRRRENKIDNLNLLLKELKDKGLIESNDSLELLYNASNYNKDLINRQLFKARNKSIKTPYSPELRKFALTLNFYSPRAYSYVRDSFNSCLPHPRTISKWYRRINAEPGFTEEALKALKLKVLNTDYPLFFSLIYDEMAIRQQVEFDGTKFHGYIEVGFKEENDSLAIAKEAFVFIVVCINGNFKVPVGYFLSDGLTSLQKSNLVKQCLILLYSSNVNVVSLTFDGLQSNFSMSKHLGCCFAPLILLKQKKKSSVNMPVLNQDEDDTQIDLNWHEDKENSPSTSIKQNSQTTIKDSSALKLSFSHPVTKNKVFIFPDPSHMIKLIRNCLGDKGSLVDPDNNLISWNYIKALHQLQETEGLHLANKLTESHIFYGRRKMKTKLATQVFSKSLADAIEFCRVTLKLSQFQGSEGTEKFLRKLNDLFDIMNCRSLKQFGLKQALNANSYDYVFRTLEETEIYLSSVKVSQDGESILNSNRKTGFLGFIICIKNTIQLYQSLVMSSKLVYLPMHKISQDHVELFFQMIRAQGGFNNNPTVRQFKSAYKKLLLKTEVRNTDTGNCIPLNDISLLTVSSTELKSPEEIINASTDGYRVMDDEEEAEQELAAIFNDHDYLFTPYLNECSQHIVFYIAGYVVHYLSEKLKCDICVSSLHAATPHYFISLIDYKNVGKLSYPSEDAFSICKLSELKFRNSVNIIGGKFLRKDSEITSIANNTLDSLIGKKFFKDLDCHMYDMSPLENHSVHLIRAIVYRYLKIRFFHFSKTIVNRANSLRQLYTKAILFKGH